ncbi:membrane protein [Brevibacillus panacihumi W25]|uniref:Membrane protein n=1 Tax=Brevibacillus panacihumi W25 TaxID=1408254 RepID=V6M7L8_9BACL|nr:DMT family transporter [Brevibacillus panacihumi]EST54267.1 membrane protein [Brevibacillus panacihumi W25]
MQFAHVKIMMAMAIVGSSVVFGKIIASRFPVFLASELRFIIASAILLALFYRREKTLPAPAPRHMLSLFLQALTGVFLFNICMLYGLRYTTAIEAGIITSTLPAVVGIIAFLFLKEHLTAKKGLGILLAVCGVLLINFVGEGAGSPSSIIGNLLIFAAVVGEALFITLGKKISTVVSPLMISTLMSLFGVLLFLPFAIYEALYFDFHSVGVLDWLNILYFGVVVTVIAFLLMYQGLSKVSASSAGVLTSVLPVSSLILSAVILQETITLYHLLGMGFVFGAIFILSLEPKEKLTQRKEADLQ